MANASGMGFEASTCMVVCQDTTWDAFLQNKSREVKKWRGKRFPAFFLCEALYGGTLATGSRALSTNTSDEAELEDVECADDIESETSSLHEPDENNERQNEGISLIRNTTPQSSSRNAKRQRKSLASIMAQNIQDTNDNISRELNILTELLQTSQGESISASGKATKLLQSEFAESLSMDDMLLAMDVIANDSRASMFLEMSGDIQIAWLRRKIELQKRAES
ncbi:hypothetical protein Ae201684P_006722 [Aphanomyces euteiches]|nr:hypothetical protein Ae201684P_006722 [Aphanomyces euteiches]